MYQHTKQLFWKVHKDSSNQMQTNSIFQHTNFIAILSGRLLLRDNSYSMIIIISVLLTK